MILPGSGNLRFGMPVMVLTIALSGCDPSKPAVSTTPAHQAFAPAVKAPAQTPQPPALASPPAQITAQQQRVKSLIEQVDKAYADGQADYKKGDLVAARADFDHAVDLMLTSGIDIKSTPELQDEFDRIVDQINDLEMEALRQGNGFTPKTEATPA